MSTTAKRRAVVSYENMSDEVAAAFAEKYPRGYSDYFPDLMSYPKPDGTSFYEGIFPHSWVQGKSV